MQVNEEYRKIENTLSQIFPATIWECNENNITLKQILNEIDNYIAYIDSKKKKYSKKQKQYSLEHIAEEIFSEITEDNFRLHIEAFYISIKAIKDELCSIYKNNEEIKINNYYYHGYIKGRLSLLNDIILDFNAIYWQIEEFFGRPQQRKIFIRRKFMGREVFETSINILWRNISYQHHAYSSVSVFLLRQTIEITTLRALGIYSFVDDKENEQKFKLGDILKFIKNNKKHIKFPIKSSILRKIIHWSNSYIHSAIKYYHWQMIIAQKVLEPLFSGGEDNKSMSIHGAIQINREFYENQLEKDLIQFLKFGDNIKIEKLEKPDCLLTDNIFE